jgi:group I intron endonuclease
MSGSIYKITCKPTGKVYVGQTCDFKIRNDIAYNYGPTGRWVDHVSSAKRTDTPLAQAIREYGKEEFELDVLEQDILEKLDELEAKWIRKLDCIWPNGLNVAGHSRNKHHLSTTLQDHYKDITLKCSIRPIKRDGEYRLVYLVLQLKDGQSVRLTFGQNSSASYETALKDAKIFASGIGCPVEEQIGKYDTKLKQLEGKSITKVRITTASKLIAVYITTSDMTSYKEQIRICFGGKTVSSEDAYNEALAFIELLDLDETCTIENSIPSKLATGDCLKG